MSTRVICFVAVLINSFACLGAEVSKMDMTPWALLAIQDAGRRKPMDTFAKETLLRLSGRTSYKSDTRLWSANEFVLSSLLDIHDWKKEPLILADYKPLVAELKLDAIRKRFSFEELAAAKPLQDIVQRARDDRKSGKELSRLQKEAESVATRMMLFGSIQDGSAFLIVPPPKSAGDRWLLPTEFAGHYPEASYGPAMDHLRTLASAYLAGDSFKFSLNANQLRSELRKLSPNVYPTDSQLTIEYFYNHLDPFQWAIALYGISLVALSIASKSPSARISYVGGLVLATAGVLFHAGGIALRCIIAGRPPVTNMFESVVWVSFGVMAFGLAFFLRYRTLTYLIASLPVSLVCLLLLRQLPIAMPESIDPLVPVLRSNFWLTTHVLTITLSYAAFALAMGFGHIVLYRYIKTPAVASAETTLHFWLYRVLQLGILLLAIGTILGGVWANYSWGRFWGWDPKETWALIALLCYILVLHGRIAGWWGQFGLAVASVICFCAVMMTWYGVNFILGKGLHSYGFGIGGELYVSIFVALDLAYVALACIRYQAYCRMLPPEPLPQKQPLDV